MFGYPQTPVFRYIDDHREEGEVPRAEVKHRQLFEYVEDAAMGGDKIESGEVSDLLPGESQSEGDYADVERAFEEGEPLYVTRQDKRLVWRLEQNGDQITTERMLRDL